MAMQLGGQGARAAINVTPMIDVLLVLLIILMVVVNPLAMGLEAQVPQPAPRDATPPEKAKDIVVLLHADGSLTLNQETVAQRDLAARFAQIFRARGNTPIFVGADPDLEFDPVLQVIDAARGAGLERVALLPRGSF